MCKSKLQGSVVDMPRANHVVYGSHFIADEVKFWLQLHHQNRKSMIKVDLQICDSKKLAKFLQQKNF